MIGQDLSSRNVRNALELEIHNLRTDKIDLSQCMQLNKLRISTNSNTKCKVVGLNSKTLTKLHLSNCFINAHMFVHQQQLVRLVLENCKGEALLIPDNAHQVEMRNCEIENVIFDEECQLQVFKCTWDTQERRGTFIGMQNLKRVLTIEIQNPTSRGTLPNSKVRIPFCAKQLVLHYSDLLCENDEVSKSDAESEDAEQSDVILSSQSREPLAISVDSWISFDQVFSIDLIVRGWEEERGEIINLPDQVNLI